MSGLLGSPVFWTRFLHLIAAIWLTVGVFGSAVVLAMYKRASDPTGRAFGARTAWRLMTVYTLPGVLAAGLLGIYQAMVAFNFRPGWVHASVTLWLIQLAIILFVQMPRLKAAAQRGADIPPVVIMLTHVSALLILVMAFLMSFKPF
jgi:uncharacterized membrane protein